MESVSIHPHEQFNPTYLFRITSQELEEMFPPLPSMKPRDTANLVSRIFNELSDQRGASLTTTPHRLQHLFMRCNPDNPDIYLVKLEVTYLKGPTSREYFSYNAETEELEHLDSDFRG